MPKKWIATKGGPEMKTYFVEVSVPRIKKTKDGVPLTFPGTNITSAQLEESEKGGGLSTQAAHIAEALGNKEE